MLAVGEDHLLRQAIGWCSRGAVASKAAYMLTRDRAAEQALLKRCTERYGLLECLLGLLIEHDTRPEEARRLLETINLDPTGYRHAEAALTVLRQADDRLAAMLADALAEHDLSPRVEACFEDALLRLGAVARDSQPEALLLPPRGGCGQRLGAFD